MIRSYGVAEGRWREPEADADGGILARHSAGTGL